MNKVLKIIEREYLERVKKKSFIIATILTPLIFPAFIAIVVLIAKFDSSEERLVQVIDKSGLLEGNYTISDTNVEFVDIDLEDAKKAINSGDIFGVLYIPKLDIEDPKGVEFYAKNSPSIQFVEKLKRPLRDKIEALKLEKLEIDKEILDQLRTSVSIATFNVSESGESKKSSSGISYGLGYGMAFLMYLFVFVYGSFIMQSVLNEKTSKIVEVIVSSVKPFQLMIGKVLGNAAVAFTQFAIWIILIAVTTTAATAILGYNPNEARQEMVTQQLEQAGLDQEEVASEIPDSVKNALDAFYNLPLAQIIVLFFFYFLGGFLLFGALFAAVGSAVDSIQEAQQFMLPISLPIIASIMLMQITLQNPAGGSSVALSMIPFTSPIIMMARIPFGVPFLQLAASMLLLILGFLFTLWLAGRIYRVGILTSGSKVTWKTLATWFRMKNY